MPFVAQVYPSLRYTMALNRSPSVIAAPAFTAATGSTRRRHQDRRRRRRRRPPERVLQRERPRLPGRLPARDSAASRRQGDRRARASPARAPAVAGACRSIGSPRSTARTSPASLRADAARALRAGATTRRRRGSPASRRRPGSATTASSTCRPPIGHIADTPRDRRRVRGGRARRHGRDQFLRRRPRDRAANDALVRDHGATSPTPESCR